MGVKGARVSIGLGGTYVHLGAGGLRYRRRIDMPPPPPRTPRPAPADASLVGGQRVEHIDPARIIDTTADGLLTEIRQMHQKPRLSPLCIGLGGVLGLFGPVALASGAAALGWVALAAGLLCVLALPWVRWRDCVTRTVRIFYSMDRLGEQVHEGLGQLFGALRRAEAIWSVQTRHAHGDWKRNAGAGQSVQRQRVVVGTATPSEIVTNVAVHSLSIGPRTLYFFPDRILVFGSSGVGALSYKDLALAHGTIQFIEHGWVPGDAQVVGHTWQFVNKNGTPDRRFANNRQLPVALYGCLDIEAGAGFRVSLQTSRADLAQASCAVFALVQKALAVMEATPAKAGKALPAITGADMPAVPPPPLAGVARGFARAMATANPFRWVPTLPSWAQPIVWAAGATAPIAIVAALLLGGGRSPDSPPVAAIPVPAPAIRQDSSPSAPRVAVLPSIGTPSVRRAPEPVGEDPAFSASSGKPETEPGPQPEPPSLESLKADLPKRDFTDQARSTVILVPDGNSVMIRDQAGDRTYRALLVGVALPSTVHPGPAGKALDAAAHQFLKDLLSDQEVYVEEDPALPVVPGREWAYLYRTSDGLFVNLEMLGQGHAVLADDPPFLSHELFERFEEVARLAQRGHWNPTSQGVSIADVDGAETWRSTLKLRRERAARNAARLAEYMQGQGSFAGSTPSVGPAPSILPSLDMSRPVHVRGYYRKDGTYVRSHTRSLPRR